MVCNNNKIIINNYYPFHYLIILILFNYLYVVFIVACFLSNTSIIFSFHHHSSCHNIHIDCNYYSEVTKFIDLLVVHGKLAPFSTTKYPNRMCNFEITNLKKGMNVGVFCKIELTTRDQIT